MRSLFYSVHTGGCPRGDRGRFSTQEDYKSFQQDQARVLRTFLELRARKCRHVIISDEYLFGLDHETISRLGEFLGSAGHDDVRVIVYLREPASLFLSLAQQRLKADYRLSDPCSWYYPYAKSLESWMQIFPGRVEVRAFERSALVGGSVVTDFFDHVAHVLNLKVDGFAALDSGEDANQSVCAEGMALLYEYQKKFHMHDPGRFTQDGRRLTWAVLEASKKLGLERPRLREEIREVIIFRHRTELMAMAELYGIRFSSVDYHKLDSSLDLLPEDSSCSGGLSMDYLLENLDRDSADRLKLQCLAELSSWNKRGGSDCSQGAGRRQLASTGLNS